ncbi:hypothetical protein CKM354_000625800 [Cercospora kikuchii]|uniref:Uncharacterized protein n=1 Tax=Cercospora kikuchii TaxID=84275 RepID=A0A9P3CKE9_9PEZI|nr:uncharacterized protein CKM354_000625800 [Cercospora kikuchii]GIZ43012.1 hypothetical protein CKM354_000625800 [Cercospora kikuchii]
MAYTYHDTSSQSDLESVPFISEEKTQRRHGSILSRVVFAARSVKRDVLVAVLASVITVLAIRSYDQFFAVKTGSCEDMQYGKDSPIRTIDRSFHTETFPAFNYSSSPYTQHPSEGDVDARWDALGVDSGHFLVPVSEGDKYGFDKSRHVIMPEEVVGQESYIVSLDVMHHLHCLDTLRIALWYNREWYLENTNEHATHAVHVAHTNHCLDAIRERLMCLSDVTFIPSIWIDREGWILPDFEREHKCHNFDAVRDWAYANQMPGPVRNYTFIAGPDAELTTLPGFYDEYPERRNKDHKVMEMGGEEGHHHG